MRVFTIDIDTLPKMQSNDPIPFVKVNVAIFLSANTNAAKADEQKLSPVSAT